MVPKKPSVLIVDDDKAICDVLRDELTDQGYRCTTAFDGDTAAAKLAKGCFDVALLDIKLPLKSGLEVLREIQSRHCDTVPVVITCVGEVDTAVEAMQLGASDYIVKPFDLDRVNASIRVALDASGRLSKKRDYEPAPCIGDQEEDKAGIEECFKEINAIAHGVEARHDLLFGHSKMVTEETVEIARWLGILEEVIQSWEITRSERDSERKAAIESLLNRLKRSLLAQRILGIIEPYRYVPRPSENEN